MQDAERKILIADIGTGSGNIIISIAAALMVLFPILHSRFSVHPACYRYFRGALTVAKQNAARHGVNDIIAFHTGDLLEPHGRHNSSADEIIIVANLPYLSEEIYQAAGDNVKNFEPRGALLSGKAGLNHYFRLLDQAGSLTKPAVLFLEISPEQAPLLTTSLATRFPHATVSVSQDLSGQDRIVEIRL